MGCCESRSIISIDVDEHILKAEYSLGLSKIPLEKIECEFAHFSSNKMMTPSQLKSFSEKIGLCKDSVDFLVFGYFNDRMSNMTPLMKIITFTILISSGEKAFKVETLFKHFKENESENLTKIEASEMIENIYDVSVLSLTRLTMSLEGVSKSDVFFNYYEKLSKMRPVVISFLVNDFCENRIIFDEHSFRTAFCRLEMNVLLIPRLLRKFTYKLYRSSSIRRKVTMEGVQTVENLDLKLVKKISRKLSKIDKD